MLKHQTQYKIIISGFSSFTTNPDSSESSRVGHYLVKNGIQRSNIVLEERSMDTLGNIIFSHIITESLLQQYHHISAITLITETFHLNRSKRLFIRIFGRLLKRYHVQSHFTGSENQRLEQYQRTQKTYAIFSNLYQGTLVRKDAQQFIYTLCQRWQRDMQEIIILELLFVDFRIFRLRTFKQFQNYLYNLPVYNTIYHTTTILNLALSLYSRAIKYVISLR
jgi:hypothetical protein